MTKKLPRGIRNNNPLNIRISATRWNREIEGTDAEFETFESAEWGIRAAAVLLRNYQRIYKLDTIKKIITRWAPHVENDTNAYVANVCKSAGITPDQKITLENDFELFVKVIKGMIQVENGQQPYTDATIMRAVQLATGRLF